MMLAPSTASSDPPRQRVRRTVVIGLALLVLVAVFLWTTSSVLAPFVAGRLSALTGADVRIGWITYNPLAGRAVLHRVAVAATTTEPALATAEAIIIDAPIRSWLAGDRHLDSVVLRRPWIALRRTATGDFDIAKLAPKLAPTATAGTPDAAASANIGPPPPFRIGLFRIRNGSIEFHDETTSPELETSLYMDDARARDLVLAGDGRIGLSFHIESRIDNDPLTLDLGYIDEGDTSSLTVELVVARASLARALLYAPFGWQRTSGTMDATVTYARRSQGGLLREHVLRADLALHDLALTEPWAEAPMLRAKGVRLPSLTVDFVKQRTDLGAIEVEDYRAVVSREGERVRVPLVAGAPGIRSASAWKTTLDRVALGQGVAVLRAVFAPPEIAVPISVGSIRLAADDTVFTFTGTLADGGITLDGRTHGDTTTLTFGFDGLDLTAAAPLVSAPVEFTEGRVGGTVRLTLSPAEATVSGTVTAKDARTVPLDPHPEEVFAWRELTATIAKSTLDPLTLDFERVKVEWPYIMVHRRPEGVFPFRTSTQASAPSPPVAASTPPAHLRIQRLEVTGGRIEFYDTTLPRAYGIDLTDLVVAANEVSLPPLGANTFTLTGALDELSPVLATGRIESDSATLSVAVDRLLLAPLNPYLAAILGYEVDAGLARIAANVRVVGRKISADTDLALSRFSMRAAGADPVGSRIGTPLSVALALMKDTRGDIRLRLPIEGDIAANEYRVENLLREALGTALLGTLRAPLGFVRGIFHKDEGYKFDLRPVPFPPGSAALDTEGEARLAELARLLGRQQALRAVLIPVPSRTDFDAVTANGAPHPLDTLAGLVHERGAVVAERLARQHGVDPRRIVVEEWVAAEPDIGSEPGVDVRLRTE